MSLNRDCDTAHEPRGTPKTRAWLAGLMFAVTTMLLSGCESLVFAFANRGLPPPEASAVYAPDKQLALDIYRPPASDGDAPVVVFFYGGSWKRGDRGQYRFVGQQLARQGMLAIVPDYRTWPRAGFPDFMHDAAQAVAWAREHAAEYGGDPRRLFIAGHSAGAQIAGLLGADARYLVAQGVSLDDIAGVIGLSGPYDFVISSDLAPIFGPRAQWPRAQAVRFVSGDEPPFLLIHGQDDDVVEARDSVELADALREQGVRVELVLLPDAGHVAPLWGLYDPQAEPAVLPAIVEFVGL